MSGAAARTKFLSSNRCRKNKKSIRGALKKRYEEKERDLIKYIICYRK